MEIEEKQIPRERGNVRSTSQGVDLALHIANGVGGDDGELGLLAGQGSHGHLKLTLSD